MQTRTLDFLPKEISLARILDSGQAADFLGISVVQLRRMYRTGRIPAPIRIGERKLGWRARDLAEWLEARTAVSFMKPAPQRESVATKGAPASP
jgi:predicted DNA-binding transcriptional regulator AlpA